MQTNAERLTEKHAKEMAEAVRLDRIAAELPAEPRLMCAHSDHVSVMYGGGYKDGERHAERDTFLALFNAFPALAILRRRGTFLYSKPLDMYRDKDTGKDEGTHAVSLHLTGGRGFGPNLSARWWADCGGERVHFDLALNPHAAGAPRMRMLSGHYDRGGNPVGFRFALEGVPNNCATLSWAGGSPDHYVREICFATVPNFLAWLDTQTKPEPEPQP